MGEDLEIYKEENLEKVVWTGFDPSVKKPITWYKVSISCLLKQSLKMCKLLYYGKQFDDSFHAPEDDDSVALDLRTMGKGEAQING